MEWGQISILAQKKPTWVVAQVAVPLSSWSHSPPGKQEREHRTGGAVRRCRQRVPCSPTDPQLYSSGVKDALQWCHAAGPELPLLLLVPGHRDSGSSTLWPGGCVCWEPANEAPWIH